MKNSTSQMTSERRIRPHSEFVASLPTGILTLFGISFAFVFFVYSDPGAHSRQHDVSGGFDSSDAESIKSIAFLLASVVSFLCAAINNRNDKERNLLRKLAKDNVMNVGNHTVACNDSKTGKIILGILLAILPVHAICPASVSSMIVSALCAVNIGVLLSCILKTPRKIAKYMTLGSLLHGLAWTLSMSVKGIFQ